MAAAQVAPVASHRESVREVSSFPLHWQYAERLCARLGQAAHHVGLSQFAQMHNHANIDALQAEIPPKSLGSMPPPPNLYDHLFGADFPAKLAPQPSTLQIPPTPSRHSSAVPHTPPSASGNKRTASEALSEAAAAPQLGSSHRAGSHSTDLHNHPTPVQLLREQHNARQESYGPSPKRARTSHAPETFAVPFRFPVSPVHPPRPSAAGPLTYNYGMTPRAAVLPRHAPLSRPGHMRMASMPEPHRDTYVPVRGYDPVPPASSEAAMMRPWAGAPRGFQALRSHVRAGSTDMTAPLSRKHRRSISQGALDSNMITPRPVSHDRSSSMKTPPAGDSALPVTPKTMNGSLSYGEFLNISPSPQPRGGLRVRGAPDVLPLSPPLAPAASALPTDRQSHPPAPRGARPLWAQPTQR
ncbi:hypothetical protein MCAP1_001751 [Malassezia caprae]|uniref:Uncharacterized protein n=1 Tax=Malassezia caprae TaxID=1381934 RepID=A0AAF0E6U1_9BASI|nr:hypothetical protein MCAP1_001751 [Malassezia caprae]